VSDAGWNVVKRKGALASVLPSHCASAKKTRTAELRSERLTWFCPFFLIVDGTSIRMFML